MALHESIATTPPADSSAPAPGAIKAGLALVGIASGIGAIAASSCCLVPLVLATFGAGAGVFGVLEALAPWRVPLLAVSGAGVMLGWFAWLRKRNVACEVGPACARPSSARISLALLFLASLVVAAALGWDHIEPALLKLMARSA